MSFEQTGITFLWVFLYVYIIAASIDFGAGFFSYYTKRYQSDHTIHKIIQRYLSPVWEITNVFLVFFIVGLVSFFPEAAFYYGTALLVPGSIAIILLAIRGSYYAFAAYGGRESKFYTFLYGATGLLIPASLSTVLTIALGGFITVEGELVVLNYVKLFTSPLAWSIVLLAIFSVLFISGSFLAYYAVRAEDSDSASILRRYALRSALPTIAMGVIVFLLLRDHNPEHYSKLVDIWWVFALSVLLFIAALALMMTGRNDGTAFLLISLQFATAFFGYGAAHLPYLLYPYLSIYDGFTNETMAFALISVFAAGLAMLIPSLYLVLKLFLFDADYIRALKNR
ncbi:cytochrome d ubiquinol oxidase subunit II [Bacillus lacus]|uniref:Cytochrome d ubiquinol oxidase subunit II n=1 Tax=Metabacillus lacus TaxID=1983721 RepID=A0A7X2J103_9BACI|nr:cytochrome d ubiquinol oxidase subunit II [Metabacillus lacus]MRX73440.1 cytochrome d ubiquinol oxidase subunit II [Metabacillus lacus]